MQISEWNCKHQNKCRNFKAKCENQLFKWGCMETPVDFSCPGNFGRLWNESEWKRDRQKSSCINLIGNLLSKVNELVCCTRKLFHLIDFLLLFFAFLLRKISFCQRGEKFRCSAVYNSFQFYFSFSVYIEQCERWDSWNFPFSIVKRNILSHFSLISPEMLTTSPADKHHCSVMIRR